MLLRSLERWSLGRRQGATGGRAAGAGQLGGLVFLRLRSLSQAAAVPRGPWPCLLGQPVLLLSRRPRARRRSAKPGAVGARAVAREGGAQSGNLRRRSAVSPDKFASKASREWREDTISSRNRVIALVKTPMIGSPFRWRLFGKPADGGRERTVGPRVRARRASSGRSSRCHHANCSRRLEPGLACASLSAFSGPGSAGASQVVSHVPPMSANRAPQAVQESRAFVSCPPGHRHASTANVSAKLGNSLLPPLGAVLQLAHQTAAHLAHAQGFHHTSVSYHPSTCFDSFYLLMPHWIPKPGEAPVEASDRRREPCRAQF